LKTNEINVGVDFIYLQIMSLNSIAYSDLLFKNKVSQKRILFALE